MSSAGVVSLSEAQAKGPRQRSRPTQKKTCPALSALILNAVSASTERGGLSLPALKKALKGGGYDVTKNNARILTCVRRLVGNTCLLQTKGTGASGSFKMNKKAPAPQKKKTAVKKKKAKKVKRASAKKETADGTPAAKKSPKKKKRKSKSPKKVNKATVAKAKGPKKTSATKAKKAKSPKKPKQRVVQSAKTRSAVKK